MFSSFAKQEDHHIHVLKIFKETPRDESFEVNVLLDVKSVFRNAIWTS